MNPVLIYFLKTAISLAMFYTFYWFFLRKETFYRFNRYYFLGSIAFSFILPFFDISAILSSGQTVPTRAITESYVSFQDVLLSPVITEVPVEQARSFVLSDYLLFIYLAGVALLLLRLLVQALILVSRIKKTMILEIKDIKVVPHEKVKSPFSFFNHVFINPEQLTEENIEEVLLHEKEHISQKHSIDLLLVELVTVLQWFNPFVWLIKRSLIETHEYLADSAVLKHGVPVEEYQRALISFMLGAGNPALITPFNFSLNKKRLIMMKKIKSPAIRKWRSLLLIPLIGILITAFSGQQKPAKFLQEDLNSKTLLPDSSRLFSGKGPGLIILDGKEITREEMDKIPPSTINKVEVLKGERAAKYGEKGNKGVIIITSKQKADEHKIAGKVIDDESGKAMPGVSVIVYGTTTGMVTAPDGKFLLETDQTEAKVSLSFVGYKTVVTNLHAGSNPVIRMEKTITVINFDNLPKPQKPTQPDKPVSSDKPVFFVVEAMPEYPGGIRALKTYIENNTTYPKKAKREKVSGTVYVNFTVNTDGKVTDVYIDKKNSIDPLLDKEAVKVVAGMPDWKPAEQRGKKVPVQMSVPVAFEL